jgi:hypothetical protein
MSLNPSTYEVKIGGKIIHGFLIEMANAVIVLIWEGSNSRLGTTTITLPDRSSSQIIGERDVIVSKMIGERIAVSFNKIAMVSSNLPRDFNLDQQLIVLLDKLTGEENE